MINWGLISAVLGGIGVALAIVAWHLRAETVLARREKHIRAHVFPGAFFNRLREKHTQLDLKDCQLVARALREYFLGHLKSGRRYVGMPSRVVDDLWHEFILDTREYGRFCETAFGKYFHHTPASGMGNTPTQDSGLRTTWRYACMEENIDWQKPTRLPLLFAIDEKLKIREGLRYNLHRQTQNNSAAGCGGGSSGGGSKDCSFACSGSGLIGASAASCSGSAGSCGGGGGCGGGCGGS